MNLCQPFGYARTLARHPPDSRESHFGLWIYVPPVLFQVGLCMRKNEVELFELFVCSE